MYQFKAEAEIVTVPDYEILQVIFHVDYNRTLHLNFFLLPSYKKDDTQMETTYNYL